jgi:hypothetical protein
LGHTEVRGTTTTRSSSDSPMTILGSIRDISGRIFEFLRSAGSVARSFPASCSGQKVQRLWISIRLVASSNTNSSQTKGIIRTLEHGLAADNVVYSYISDVVKTSFMSSQNQVRSLRSRCETLRETSDPQLGLINQAFSLLKGIRMITPKCQK